MEFSLIIPCFNEEEVLPRLREELTQALTPALGNEWEVILVDDGSSDKTWSLIQAAHRDDSRFKGVRLSRNFGHQPALTAGMAYVQGRFVGIIDADLQDPPKELLLCYHLAKTEGFDVVYGSRRRRGVGLFMKFCYRTFYRLMTSLSEHPWPLEAGDFCVMKRRVALLIHTLPERARILRGLRSWVGFKQGFHEYDRPARSEGRSKYSFLKLVSLALNSLISFSTAPLRLASIIGLTMSLLTGLLGFILLLNRLIPSFTLFHFWIGLSPGVTTTVLIVLFTHSLLFFCLGILGEYLAVILREVKMRPSAIVSEKTPFLEKTPDGLLVREAERG